MAPPDFAVLLENITLELPSNIKAHVCVKHTPPPQSAALLLIKWITEEFVNISLEFARHTIAPPSSAIALLLVNITVEFPSTITTELSSQIAAPLDFATLLENSNVEFSVNMTLHLAKQSTAPPKVAWFL